MAQRFVLDLLPFGASLADDSANLDDVPGYDGVMPGSIRN